MPHQSLPQADSKEDRMHQHKIGVMTSIFYETYNIYFINSHIMTPY